MLSKWKCALLISATFLLAACGGAEDEIRIGLIAELSGDIPDVGVSCRQAAELAVEEINAAGGIALNGRKLPVRLIVEDNANSPELSTAAAHKLIGEDDVLAIVGPNPTRGALPVSETTESLKTPFITPWSTNVQTTRDARTGSPKRYAFRSTFTDPLQARALARFVRERLRLRRAAVLYDLGSDYSKGLAELFRDGFAALGGEVVAFEGFTSGAADYAPQLGRIRAARPEIIFSPNFFNEVPLQVQQARRLGIRAPFLGGDAWGSPELLELCGPQCDGFFFSTNYAVDRKAPANERFVAAYRNRFQQEADDVAALTYDAFGLLLRAIRTAGRADREAVRDALAGIEDFEGVTGDMKFTPGSGDPAKSVVIVQIKGGRFVYHDSLKP